MTELPADFDSEEYLGLNADVAAAKMDAAYHYLTYGRREGRHYRKPPPSDQPLIFFVHVAKTAGSTVNSYLHQHFPHGRSHCEAFFNSDSLADIASAAPWLSGHVDLSTAEARLSAVTTRQVRYFSVVREPTKQVISHYNWLIEIAHKGSDFYMSHPTYIREISEAIRASGTGAASIAANLQKWSWLFLNMQTRTVLGNAPATGRLQIMQRLERYECICRSEDISPLLQLTLGISADRERFVNSSRYHFDPGVFLRDELVECLATHNAADRLLYDLVGSRLECRASS